MRSFFTREPDSANMVAQPGPGATIDLLCVECGWEGIAGTYEQPSQVFRLHPCKLRTTSISTSF